MVLKRGVGFEIVVQTPRQFGGNRDTSSSVFLSLLFCPPVALRLHKDICLERDVHMAKNDIYNTEQEYVRFKENLREYLKPPEGKRKFQIQYSPNLKYFEQLFLFMEARDGAYCRRMKYIRALLIACHYIKKDLGQATREDMTRLLLDSHKHNRTPIGKHRFVREVKFIWKHLLSEKDHLGREDETIEPFVVRHLEYKVDRSQLKLAQDLLTPKEMEKLFTALGHDPRMQALMALIYFSLSRPQETLQRRLEEVELQDLYGKITISEFGKEGPRIIWVIEAHYYVSQWFNQHPLKDNPGAYLFINLGNRNKYEQMTPFAANKQLKGACRRAGINKPITLYSLKRNGVTHALWRGEHPTTIQNKAGWTTVKQIDTYNLSGQEDQFKAELMRRNLISSDERLHLDVPTTKTCIFCKAINGMAERICITCKRPLDRKAIEGQIASNEEEKHKLHDQIQQMQEQLAILMEKDQARATHDDDLNRLVNMPEFQALWQREIMTPSKSAPHPSVR